MNRNLDDLRLIMAGAILPRAFEMIYVGRRFADFEEVCDEAVYSEYRTSL